MNGSRRRPVVPEARAPRGARLLRAAWSVLLALGPGLAGRAQGGAPLPAPLDVGLADALVADVFGRQDGPRYGQACEAYLFLIARAGDSLDAADAAVVRGHLAALAPILPAGLRTAARLGEGEEAAGDPPPGTGALLAAWWRSQDNLPATDVNERLAEHLERVAFADRHFRASSGGEPHDARGRIYVRLGPPRRKVEVRYDLYDEIAAFPEVASEMPEGELWVYDHVSRDAQYLFVRPRGREFRIGQVYDLVPRTLRTGLGTTGRGRARAQALLAFLTEVYAQLSVLHPYYAERYAEVANYGDLVALNQRSRGGESPAGFLNALLVEARAEDEQAGRRREEAVPRAHTGVFGTAEPLPVAVRWARFLEADGTTRTELYWGLAAETLRPSGRLVRLLEQEGHEPGEHYLLRLTAVQQEASFRRRLARVEHHLLPDAPADPGFWVPGQTLVLRGDTGCYHVAVQWDQHWATLRDGDRLRPGPRLKIGSYRTDTLHALRGSGALEMSDLKPLRIPDGGALPPDSLAAGAAPYPFTALSEEDPLALYFELYHLGLDPQARTRYDVEYEVAHLSGGRREVRTAVRSRYSGDAPTARELIHLDLQAPARGAEVVVTVRVTDAVTGARAERSVRFRG